MASGLLPKSPVSSSLCDEVPHIFIPKLHLEPREFLISSAKRLLQQYHPKADTYCGSRNVRFVPIATNAPQQRASYLFTSSARASSVAGTEWPSALAVLRLKRNMSAET